jgi:AICAR transformylase/IMP cyclohydrolase PurH
MAVLLGAVPASAAAAQEAVLAYQRAIAQVCQKKVTAEMTRLYQEALKEMQTTRYGQGQESNFFGLRSPERAYNDCIQAPGTVPR